jgi:uncharacterized protein YbaR (Trm112 family)
MEEFGSYKPMNCPKCKGDDLTIEASTKELWQIAIVDNEIEYLRVIESYDFETDNTITCSRCDHNFKLEQEV